MAFIIIFFIFWGGYKLLRPLHFFYWRGPSRLSPPSRRPWKQCLINPSKNRLRVTLENVETDPAELVDVRVVYLGHESDLGRRHGILLGQEQLQLEYAALVRRLDNNHVTSSASR